MLEACAGLLEGDTPQDCARKEAIEETGIAPREIRHAFDIYASPGSLTEKTHCFIGIYGAEDKIAAGGGLAHEGEDIEIIELDFKETLAMIAKGEIIDAKTVALLQHVALERFQEKEKHFCGSETRENKDLEGLLQDDKGPR